MTPTDRPTFDLAAEAASFRVAGHELIDRLADYLTACAGRPTSPVLPWLEPAEQVAAWPAEFPGGADPVALLERVVAGSNHLHHPRYVGHQVTSTLPVAALANLVGSLLNSAVAVYEMGPVATAMERTLARWLGARLGWDETSDGFFTGGGSQGNLTALLAARQARAGFDVWAAGQAAGPPLAVLVGEQSHYSVTRAVQVLGLGREGAVPVAVDDRYRLDPADLPAAWDRAVALGRRPIAVAAATCSTATGAFDPLEPIADFCADRGLWLHVDGAHGASAALSDRYRHLLAGIERADSVVWDAHKMMQLPACCTAVLFRDGRRSFDAFRQEASYLLHRTDPTEEWYNLCGRTLECTKPMLAVPLYVALATHGEAFFGEHVASRFDLGRRFGELLAAEPDFELPVAPEGNIVCFRWRPAAGGQVDALQAEIRRRIIAEGSFYLVQTRLAGATWLRVTLINPLTNEADLRELIATVRRVGQGLEGK